MSNLPGHRHSGNLVYRIREVRIVSYTLQTLETYGIDQSSKQKESSFDQIVGHSRLFHHLREAKDGNTMYQRCKPRQAGPYKRKCSESAILLAVEPGI